MEVDSATYIYHHEEQCSVQGRRIVESDGKKRKRVAHSVHVFPEIEPVATTREEERLYRVISPREDARSPESRSTFPLRNAPSFFETITTMIYLIDVNVDLTWNIGDINAKSNTDLGGGKKKGAKEHFRVIGKDAIKIYAIT